MAEKNRNVWPRFYLRDVEDKAATAKAGRPIYRDVEYVEIIIGGDKLSKPNYKVSDKYRNQFPREYELFKAGMEAVQDGTALKHWPVLTPAQVREFNGFGLLTIEALADMPDGAIVKLGPGARQIVKKAQAWLKDAKDHAIVSEQAEEIVSLKTQIEAMEQRLNSQATEFTKQISELRSGVVTSVEAAASGQISIIDEPEEAVSSSLDGGVH